MSQSRKNAKKVYFVMLRGKASGLGISCERPDMGRGCIKKADTPSFCFM